MNSFPNLRKKDPALARLVSAEVRRQEETLNLIASENFVSPVILELLGSALTNKYSEGYPGKRYYPGNVNYDAIERLAQARALKVFKLSPRQWACNVQPYSGSPANIEIYAALMNFGDTLLGMSLSAGGHLTHGHAVNFSGRAWRAVQYGVDPESGLIDYHELKSLARRHRPKVIVSGITAYPRQVDFRKFGAIAREVGAYHVADISHIAGLVAAGLHPSPFPHADVVMTTTHKTMRGPRGAVIFSRRALAEKIDRSVFPGMQGGPHGNVTAAIAAMFGEALRPLFRAYQRQIIRNAKALARALKTQGFRLITDGTDNHMVLVDIKSSVGIDGFRAEQVLERIGIIANRNSIPGDTSPFRPSGLRLGTPALTSRGMKEQEMKTIAQLIHTALRHELPAPTLKRNVLTLCKHFPLHGAPRR
ncbi:MAG: serine hydroxymethyltransferase [Candidatus Sungbacteria bacterium]|uniref:Serine hydroxymethyltransferase n=1 Tax=Candidatus Sungiibacteriota bacterium TaxID=2750080 RepID=A0A932YWN3_9BACT|nr:serine hydroxymethyltransferase [Candidatus Sungbacteria bacterium]